MSILPQEEIRAMLSISQSITSRPLGAIAPTQGTVELSSILSISEELREVSKINRAIAQSLRSHSAAQRETAPRKQPTHTLAQRLVSV